MQYIEIIFIGILAIIGVAFIRMFWNGKPKLPPKDEDMEKDLEEIKPKDYIEEVLKNDKEVIGIIEKGKIQIRKLFDKFRKKE